jgi:hypothetical protein
MARVVAGSSLVAAVLPFHSWARTACRQAAIAGQRSLLEAAVSAALPAPFASVASVADREGLG